MINSVEAAGLSVVLVLLVHIVIALLGRRRKTPTDRDRNAA